MFEQIKKKIRVKLLAQKGDDLARVLKIPPDSMTPFQELAMQLLLSSEPSKGSRLLTNPYTRVDMTSLSWCLCDYYFRNEPRIVKLRKSEIDAYLDAIAKMEDVLEHYVYIGFYYLQVVDLDIVEMVSILKRGRSEFIKTYEGGGLDAFIKEAERRLILPDYNKKGFIKTLDDGIQILPSDIATELSIEFRSWFTSTMPLFLKTTEKCVEWVLESLPSHEF